jgi:hypothetical protein
LLPWPVVLFSLTEHETSIHWITLCSHLIMHVLAINFPFGSISTNIEELQHASKQKQKQKSTYLALSQTTKTGTDPHFLAPVGARIVVPT